MAHGRSESLSSENSFSHLEESTAPSLDATSSSDPASTAGFLKPEPKKATCCSVLFTATPAHFVFAGFIGGSPLTLFMAANKELGGKCGNETAILLNEGTGAGVALVTVLAGILFQFVWGHREGSTSAWEGLKAFGNLFWTDRRKFFLLLGTGPLGAFELIPQLFLIDKIGFVPSLMATTLGQLVVAGAYDIWGAPKENRRRIAFRIVTGLLFAFVGNTLYLDLENVQLELSDWGHICLAFVAGGLLTVQFRQVEKQLDPVTGNPLLSICICMVSGLIAIAILLMFYELGSNTMHYGMGDKGLDLGGCESDEGQTTARKIMIYIGGLGGPVAIFVFTVINAALDNVSLVMTTMLFGQIVSAAFFDGTGATAYIFGSDSSGRSWTNFRIAGIILNFFAVLILSYQSEKPSPAEDETPGVTAGQGEGVELETTIDDLDTADRKETPETTGHFAKV